MTKAFEKAIYDSGLIADGCWDKFDEYDKAALEKAFELLVRECAEVASDYDEAHYVGTAIEKHFGVKP
jgi:hypothetical protein